jgi:hypothetical protein
MLGPFLLTVCACPTSQDDVMPLSIVNGIIAEARPEETDKLELAHRIEGSLASRGATASWRRDEAAVAPSTHTNRLKNLFAEFVSTSERVGRDFCTEE